MTIDQNASPTTTPPATQTLHQNASLCITSDPPPAPLAAPQLPTDNALTPRNTPEPCAQVMHGGDLAPTHPRHLFTLTPTQLKALDLLLSGLPDVHIAQALGLHRTTIYRWRTLHPAFVSEFNRRRLDAWDACHQRLRHLLPRALSALGKGLRADNPALALQSATAILRHAAPDKDKLPPGERKTTTPEAFIDTFVQAIRRQKGKDPDKPITDKEREPVLQYLLDNLRAS